MPSIFDTLSHWAKKTTTSYADLRLVSPQRDEMAHGGDNLIFRLRHWPELPSQDKIADVYRALSVMSNRPVNRHWILANSKLRAKQVDSLLQRLISEEAIEVIDGSKFQPERSAKAAWAN
jgi:hypothetical protein